MDFLDKMEQRLSKHDSHDSSAFENIEPEYELPRDYISVSQVKRWLGCGKQYEFHYIEDKRGPYNSSLARGSVVHKIIERLGKYKIENNQQMPPEEFKDQVVREELKKEVQNVDEWSDKVPDAESMVEDTKALVDIYYHEVLGDVTPRFVEQRVQTQLNGRIPFLGYVDIIEVTENSTNKEVSPEHQKEVITKDDIDRGDGVRDVKVSSRKKSQRDADNSIQLTMYAELLDVLDVGFHNLAQTKAGNRKFHNIQSDRQEGDRVHAVNVVEDVASAISQGVFPKTNPGDWRCDKEWCPFWDQCRGKHLQVANPDDAACMSGNDDNDNEDETEDDDE